MVGNGQYSKADVEVNSNQKRLQDFGILLYNGRMTRRQGRS